MEEFHMISNLEPIKEKISIQDEIDWNSKIESGCVALSKVEKEYRNLEKTLITILLDNTTPEIKFQLIRTELLKRKLEIHDEDRTQFAMDCIKLSATAKCTERNANGIQNLSKIINLINEVDQKRGLMAEIIRKQNIKVDEKIEMFKNFLC